VAEKKKTKRIKRVKERMLGELAIKAEFITREQLDACLEYQENCRAKKKKVPRIGEILAHKDFLSKKQLAALLSGKFSRQRGKFGEIAVRLGFLPRDQLKLALELQQSQQREGEQTQLIGQILRDKQQIRSHQIKAVLAAQGKTIARCLHCKKRFTIQDFQAGRFRCNRCQALLVKHTAAKTAEAATPDDGDVVIATPRRHIRLKKGQRIHDYKILGLLGKDMTGSLYRAVDVPRDRPLTFKVLDSDWLSDRVALKSFLVGAQKSAGLSHPNIKRLYAAGKAEDFYFVAMEYIQGDSLRQVLRRAKKVPVPMAIKVVVKVVDALIHAAGRDLIHRDIRPSNILVAQDGQIKVSGFGVPVDLGGNLRLFAREKRGSACYMAPELVVEAEVDSRADIFGLGCTLYHLLSGRSPLRGRSPVDVLMRMCEKGIPPLRKLAPNVPEDLERVITQMIQLEPDDRYQSLYQLERELQVIGADVPGLDL